jgi:hypothetical protein
LIETRLVAVVRHGAVLIETRLVAVVRSH